MKFQERARWDAGRLQAERFENSVGAMGVQVELREPGAWCGTPVATRTCVLMDVLRAASGARRRLRPLNRFTVIPVGAGAPRKRVVLPSVPPLL